MNLGLGNLATLKAWVLAPELVAKTTFDVALATLGRGVAAAMERACDRRFGRVVGAQVECPADRLHLTLDRYPVEIVTTVELRPAGSETWSAQSGAVESLVGAAGLVYFSGRLGSASDRLRVTFTGGYWFDETEDATGVAPGGGGAAALPDDLRLAWLQQCAYVWENRKKLGVPINGAASQSTAAVTMTFLPPVAETLRAYRRYALT